MLRLRFIWVFKPIFLFNIFIIFPLYCYLYIGTLFKILFSEFILELLRFLLVLRVILKLYYLFALSELYWNSVSSFCSQSYNGTRVNLKLKNYLYELRVILELWNNKLSYFRNCSHWGTRFSLRYKVSNTAELDFSQVLNWTT